MKKILIIPNWHSPFPTVNWICLETKASMAGESKNKVKIGQLTLEKIIIHQIKQWNMITQRGHILMSFEK